MIALSLDRLGDLGLFKLLKKSLITATIERISLAATLSFSDIVLESEHLAKDIESLLAEMKDVSSSTGVDIDSIEHTIEGVNGELGQLRAALATNQQTVEKDFGPDDELFAFFGKCFNYRDRKYSYEICPFSQAKQDGRTTLGRYTRYGVKK